MAPPQERRANPRTDITNGADILVHNSNTLEKTQILSPGITPLRQRSYQNYSMLHRLVLPHGRYTKASADYMERAYARPVCRPLQTSICRGTRANLRCWTQGLRNETATSFPKAASELKLSLPFLGLTMGIYQHHHYHVFPFLFWRGSQKQTQGLFPLGIGHHLDLRQIGCVN